MKTMTTPTKVLHTAALTLFLAAMATPSLASTTFTGNLKGVTITDAQAVNKPPVAAFTYTINGNIITVDASSSSDPDGSITKYSWKFGNDTTAEGANATYALAGATPLQVTLTVTDNNQGIAIYQQTITSNGLTDDFSTNSVADYTIFSGGLNIYDGKAYASGAWKTTYAIHNKELASSDHWVEADVYTDGANATGGLLFRFNRNEKMGYMASFSNGNVVIHSYSSGTKNWMTSYNGKFAAGTYKLRAEISGNIIKIFVNGNLVLQATNTTHTTGNNIGLYIEPYGKDTIVGVDDLTSK